MKHEVPDGAFGCINQPSKGPALIGQRRSSGRADEQTSERAVWHRLVLYIEWLAT